MYPLLLEFNDEFDKSKSDSLTYILENIGDTTVKNGAFLGANIKDALREFGKTAFGENGINTCIFRSCVEKETLLEQIKKNDLSTENSEDTVIYPFGVVNKIMNGDQLTAYSLSLNGKAGIFEEKSFLLIFVLENDCLLSDFDSTMKAEKGNCIFIPAKTRVELIGEAELVLIHK